MRAVALPEMPRPTRGPLWCLLLLLLVAPGPVALAQQPQQQQQDGMSSSDTYLYLLNKNNRSTSHVPDPTQKTLCGGKKAGDVIEGRYTVFFKTNQVTSVAQGIYAVRRALRAQATARAASAASGLPADGTAPVTPALTFTIDTVLTTEPVAGGGSSAGSGGGAAASSSSSSLIMRPMTVPVVRRGRPVMPPVLGAVVTVAPGPEGKAVADSIKSFSVVQDVVPSVCMRAMEDDRFSCLPATALSSSIFTPVAAAAWDGCLTPNTFLAWWGVRCGASFSQVQWAGVYAFDRTTGARLPACVKQRPQDGSSMTADLTYWLGSCGVAPAAVPSLPGMVCRDPYVASTIVSAEQQGCMAQNFTAAVQTLQLFHPTPGCGAKQPVSMVYRGQRCTGATGDNSTAKPPVVGVLWQSAEPAAGSGMDAAKCSLARRAGAAADDAIFNMDWFGSCGVPPARVQYAPRSECPAAPPPPPPSPSPRPDTGRALDREPLKPGETIGTGMRRILAVTPSANSSTGFDTVTLLNPTAVAVMDSGVDCAHRDLNVVFNKSFNVVYSNGTDPNNDLKACWDVYDHGTNVAGIVGAKNNGYGVIGVMPNVSIISLKVLDWQGSAPQDNLLNAALWLLSNSLDGNETNENNATNAEALGIDVINMSLGYTGSPYTTFATSLCNAYKALRDLGIVIIAAAGNENTQSNTAMPAACPGVVSVTAIDQGNGTADLSQARAWFSNYLLMQGSSDPPTEGKVNMTVAAPGMDIYSTCFQQSNAFCYRTGTSQATPHVSGMLARCFSGGRCKSRGSGDASVLYALSQWKGYNLDNEEYGYSGDPIRTPNTNRVTGYLTCADVW